MQKVTRQALAKRTIAEMSAHVRKRLAGLPVVPESTVQNLVFAWIRKERPELVDALTPPEICDVIAARGPARQSSTTTTRKPLFSQTPKARCAANLGQ